MATLLALIIGLVVGLLLGIGVGWLLRQVRSEQADPADTAEDPALVAARHELELARVREQEAASRAEVQADLASAAAQVEELRDALTTTREQYRSLLEQQREVQREREAAQQERLREREAAQQQRARDLAEAQQERARTESGHTQVLKTLTPVVEHLRAMQAKVDDLEKARVQQHAELATQIQHTQRSVEDSRKAADTLSSVLKNNAVRGAWGETQLRTLVETAGLLNRVDFDLQSSVNADSGARRPDMVINLAGGKQMAIDAKVPYNAFMDSQRDGLEPEVRQRLLEEHARKVRGHVDVLSQKGYWTGLKVSPEFTVAFIPNEQLLNAALDVDPSLMEHAFASGIVLATPTNLWGLLKTVAFTWKQEALTEDAQHLFELGQVLYRRILKLSEHVDKLGRTIQRSVGDYNAFVGSLERSVLPAARKLNAADPVASIPAPKEIEETPRALTSSEFEVIADLGRDELAFDFDSLESQAPVDGEVVADGETRAG